ncbi:hypothetical protein [Rhizobium rhizogenes]|uniref:hypothetical protein n=1 Tax=Rhizobium rhizogenes TaxID=359 RepID=UPI001572C8DA|nr:hypothetical protein [Rhizobium rhizogenes]NTG07279.1 hypothetical protein [Rhizobium rhizogenes]
MVIRPLISAALVTLALSGCETTNARLSQAAITQGVAKASVPFPDLPAACIAKMGRVKAGGEPWVITMKRWDVVAENRDRNADDCAAWGRDMKARYEARSQ